MRLSAGQHFGDVSRSCEVAGFTLTETLYSPGLRLPKHSHEHGCFCLVLQGSYDEIYRKVTLACTPSSVLFRPPDELHSDHMHAVGGHCFIIEVGLKWLSQVREHSMKLDAPVTLQGGSASWLAVRIYSEFRQMDGISPLVIEGLTLVLAGELSREPIKGAASTAPRWLQQVKEILHAHYCKNLTLAYIAEMVGVHPVYLAAAFRKYYRCTIGDYVRQLRVEYACCEIINSDVPLVDIALSAGFSSQSHFSRTFKQLTGMSPAQYRALRKPS